MPLLGITLLCLCCCLVFSHLFPLSRTLVLFSFCLLAVEKSLGVISISFYLDSFKGFALFSCFSYHHRYPGAWRNLPCFPVLGVTAGGRPLALGLLSCNKTDGREIFPEAACGDGDMVTVLGFGLPRPSHLVQLGQSPAGRNSDSLYFLLPVLIL